MPATIEGAAFAELAAVVVDDTGLELSAREPATSTPPASGLSSNSSPAPLVACVAAVS